jgi:hypothetical protein
VNNFLVRWAVSILIYGFAKYYFGESFFAGWIFGCIAVGVSQCLKLWQESNENNV